MMDVFCKYCGAELKENADVCMNCGRLVEAKTTMTEPKSKAANTGVFAVFGFIFAGIALFFFPPLFGGLGIWFGAKVKSENEATGTVIVILNIICLIFGMIFGILVWI
jgi:hypothetical protein